MSGAYKATQYNSRAIRMIIDRVVSVIPAQAGIHVNKNNARLDHRMRGDDGHKIRESH